MIRKVMKFFNNNEVYKTLDIARVSQSVSSLNYIMLERLMGQIKNKQMKIILFNEIESGLSAKKWPQRLKYAIVLHYLLMRFPDDDCLTTLIQSIKIRQSPQNKQLQKLNTWINRKIIDYYLQYIQKIYMQNELYSLCEKFYQIQQINLEDISNTINGFKILNLINFILQTQQNLNKLGRYYPDFSIILDLYKMYLNDIKVLYNYLRKITEDIYDNYEKFSKETLKHNFIYIIEMQRINDKLYQFFHNRYYVKKLKEILVYPILFKYDYKKYKKLIKYIKKFDPTIPIPVIQTQQKYSMNSTQITSLKFISYESQLNETAIYTAKPKASEIDTQKYLNENFPNFQS